jgi:hypothetical protein
MLRLLMNKNGRTAAFGYFDPGWLPVLRALVCIRRLGRTVVPNQKAGI